MSTLPAKPSIHHRQDLTPSQLGEVCAVLLNQDERTIYKAGVEKLAEMVGWERLPDSRHLIHELLGRTTPSVERHVIAKTFINGWLLDYETRMHEPLSSTPPYDPRLTIWDEYALDFCDPDVSDASTEFRGSLVRVFTGDRSAVCSEHAYGIWTAEKEKRGEVYDAPDKSIQRLRSGTHGAVDLILYPPPWILNDKDRDVINAILLKRHTQCSWEMLTSAPKPWTVTPANAAMAKLWCEDGRWEKKYEECNLQKLEESVLPFPKRRRKNQNKHSSDRIRL